VPEKLVIRDAVGQREPNDRALWRKVLRLEDNFMYPFDGGHLSLSVCLSPEISLPNAAASTPPPRGTSQRHFSDLDIELLQISGLTFVRNVPCARESETRAACP
jgi:hypothetical protein